MSEYGEVTYKGTKYTLTEQAKMDNYGTEGGVRYYAGAVDPAGNEYRVAWDTTEEWDLACEKAKLLSESYLDDDQEERLAELLDMALLDPGDESNACDWANPARVYPA